MEEWDGVLAVIRTGIAKRLVLVIRHEGSVSHASGRILDHEWAGIEAAVERSRRRVSRPVRRSPDSLFDILRVLLIHWFRKSGPVSSKELIEQSGFSYPTVAKALEQLEPHLHRHSDRSIELNAFPRDAWLKLLAQSESIRASRGYTDRSGRPRPPDLLLDRLRELDQNDVAVAGVEGARRYLPAIDLVGSPRLDLIVHGGHSRATPLFLRKLDPALKPAEIGEPCQVVVHTLFRPEPFFSRSEDGLRWADEVECLLDLHDARLEAQALEFQEHLVSRAGGSAKILVVEDEPLVARLTVKLLKQFGYRPANASDEATALRLYADALKSREPYDLVLLNMSLPDGNGANEFLQEISKVDPEARVVLVTAFLPDSATLAKEGITAILPKPFTSDDLERTIRRALPQPRHSA